MKDLSADPKENAILGAAWQTFATYGYRKTSMDDIARGAGMSRPAVYLHYRNKDEIFRSLVQWIYDVACEDVAVALAGTGTPQEILAEAFRAQTVGMEAMIASPHGHELMDTGAATAMDIKEAGEARLRGMYTQWLERLSASGQISLAGEADAVAGTMTMALKGLKDAGTDFATFSQRVTMLADLFGAGLARK